MKLEDWFKKLNVETKTTESISNAALDFLSSCESFSEEDKLFLNSLNYDDEDISQLESINAETIDDLEKNEHPLNFKLNKIGTDFQIYGQVNGIATFSNPNHYLINIQFFVGSKLCKISMCKKDWTVTNEEKIIERINKMIIKEFNN